MSADTRTRLKKAAMALFLRRGYAATPIGAIEKAAGLAPRTGGFYRHYKSKEDLVVAIAREEIIEREDELGLAGLLPLGDTHAELLLIGRVYLRANRRQRKYYGLILETRAIPALAEFESKANAEMFDFVKRWIATKPAARALTGAKLAGLALTVFGGLGFYLVKRLQGVALSDVTDDSYLEDWAAYWAEALDRPPAAMRSKR